MKIYRLFRKFNSLTSLHFGWDVLRCGHIIKAIPNHKLNTRVREVKSLLAARFAHKMPPILHIGDAMIRGGGRFLFHKAILELTVNPLQSSINTTMKHNATIL